MADNEMRLTGNVAKEPELRYTAGGVALCNLTVVQSDRYQNKDKEWVDGEPNWFDVTCWRQLGENVAASIQKGMRVCVTGKMVQRKWQDKTTGENRYGWNLVADDVAPSLKWATTTVEQIERDRPTWERQPTDEEYVPPEEPF